MAASDLGNGPSLNATNAGSIAQGPFQNNVSNEQNPGLDTEQDKLQDFNQARVHLNRIIRDWDVEVEDTDVRRKTRDVEIDVEGLRQKGDLDEDETIIPVRVIDTNIQREQPASVNYLKNSRRICTFRSLSLPTQDPQAIEIEFTRGMTYCGWETPHFKCRDGADTHGWAAIEVVYDETKPLNVGLEYVAHDELYWPRSVKKLQDAPKIIRSYDVIISKLREWIRKFGFNADQVEKLAASRKDNQKENETLKVYKLYYKKEGIVFVSWFALTDGVDDWLKVPAKMVIGISEKGAAPQANIISMPGQPPQQPQDQWIDSDIKQYPIFLLPYRETEKPKEVDHKGRVFLDEAKQEAQTAILSSFVNGMTRASNLYASPDQEDGTGSSLKELEDVKLVGGRIMNKPMKWFQPPYPDPMVIGALKYLDTANSEETNQVNFAAMNREDSRKTAKEIGSAEQQQQKLNSTQLTLYSTFIREVYSFVWLIVQSQAEQGLIVFLQIQVPDEQQIQQIQQQIQQQVAQPMMMAQVSGNPQNVLNIQNQQQQAIQRLQQDPPLKWTNEIKTISQKWEIRAAGDVDVIQRQEKITQMKQDWPVVSQFPTLANRFLADLIKLEYPDTGEQYAQLLSQMPALQQAQQLSAGLATILMGFMKQHPEYMKTISPEEQQQLHQMISQAMATSGKKPGEEPSA